MAHHPSINFVLQRVLRQIGAYAISSSGPRPEEMEEARYWLDMQVAHVAGRKRTWWLVPATASFALVPGQREYVLTDVLPPDATQDGLQFVVGLWIDHATTKNPLGQVNLLRRQEYEDLVRGDDAPTGLPSAGYIDRMAAPTLRLLEAPDEATPYSARILYQAYAPNLVAGRDNAKLTKFRDAWTLWLVMATAARVGNGPVRKLPKDEVDDMKRDAAALLHDLESYDDHEQHDTPTGVQFHNGI